MTIEIPLYREGQAFIVLTVGLPASGKSTWARDLVTSEPNRWKRINRDDLRFMLHGTAHDYTNKSHEKAVTQASDSLLKMYLSDGFDVILDNTFLNHADRKAIHKIAAELDGSCDVIEKIFCVPVEECLRRNALRSGQAQVPDEVVLRMAKKAKVAANGSIPGLCDKVTSYDKVKAEPIVQDESLPPCVICDLDGTLCLMNGRNPYDASRCEEDSVNQPVLELLKKFYDSHHIVFMSGRSYKYRPETERWLQKYVRLESLYEYELFMRAEGDIRKDSIVKKELFEEHVKDKYFVRFWLDDRNQVVSMARSLGLTVFQVADGNF